MAGDKMVGIRIIGGLNQKWPVQNQKYFNEDQG
ncbi:hypothetical protein Cflav_PD5683 [Pedosphaera parvula Ellin514]|uniref:Uncharacterized protein n=1 Tax=Pedosphaera parvula (strain Ellin514) TaxID=320771 RepID=B9XAL3_PEDPL|nr:hypothetical protein Cflav_PD5683 [Pedosphaera parvula Ellin514]